MSAMMETPMYDDTYITELQIWRGEMDSSLREENGWLALYDLIWLEDGSHSIGSDPQNQIILPGHSSPPFLGRIDLFTGNVSFHSGGDYPIQLNGHPIQETELVPDTADEPGYLEIGALRMVVIQRGTKTGLRIWDNQRSERTSFPGRVWYPSQKDYRIQADFTINSSGSTLEIPNILGGSEQEVPLGSLNFTLMGKDLRLQALDGGNGRLFILFKDLTTGSETYPGGRFLRSEQASADSVVLDFNRAYNPPCAFTSYATCPLPPDENTLEIAIEAGERYFPWITGENINHDPTN